MKNRQIWAAPAAVLLSFATVVIAAYGDAAPIYATPATSHFVDEWIGELSASCKAGTMFEKPSCVEEKLDEMAKVLAPDIVKTEKLTPDLIKAYNAVTQIDVDNDVRGKGTAYAFDFGLPLRDETERLSNRRVTFNDGFVDAALQHTFISITKWDDRAKKMIEVDRRVDYPYTVRQ